MIVPTLVPIAMEIRHAMMNRPGNGHFARKDAEKEVCGALRSAGGACQPAECACHQEDEEHDDDVVIADPLRTDMDLLVEGEGLVLPEGDDERQPEGDDDRDYIEPHLSCGWMDIFKIDSASQIDDKEYEDRQECFWVWRLFLHRVFSFVFRLPAVPGSYIE